jgi:multiple sugar transport system ATP-binding protein
MAHVSVRGLEVAFGNLKVLQNLNIDVEEGEFLVLLGPSGCGKSTLLNAIAGLLDIVDGQIWIAGDNVTWKEPKDRHIGMVFQSYALYPRMTVEGNLSFGLKTARVPKPEIQKRIKGRRRPPADPAADEAASGGTVGRSAPTRRNRPGAGSRRQCFPLR